MCGLKTRMAFAFLNKESETQNITKTKLSLADLVIDQAAAELLSDSPDQLGVVTHPGAHPDNMAQWKLLLLLCLSPEGVNIAGVEAVFCHLIIPVLSGFGQIALDRMLWITSFWRRSSGPSPGCVLPNLAKYNNKAN